MNSLSLIALALFVQLGVNGENCSLWVTQRIESIMPVPFTTESPPMIIYPDETGKLNVENGHQFRLACTGLSQFELTDFRNAGDLLVSCVGGNKLLYKQQVYDYQDFKCSEIPTSELKLTGQNCQPEKFTVATVGFQTENHFIVLYSVCFDMSSMKSVYSWYEVRTPYYDSQQIGNSRTEFKESTDLYGNVQIENVYHLDNQRSTVKNILNSTILPGKFLKSDNFYSLSPGQYAAKTEFVFAFEQSATYYYANTAPQWQVFNETIWSDVEDKVRAKLEEESGRRIVVTGSSSLCSLPNESGEQQPLYLCSSNSLPVPLFFWKLVYNVKTNDGIVYVGLNNPYVEIDDTLKLCSPDMCPNEHFEQVTRSRELVESSETSAGGERYKYAGKVLNTGLVYCCTLESFQRVFGQLDLIVFGQRDN